MIKRLEKASNILDSFVDWLACNIGYFVLVWVAYAFFTGKFEIIVNGVTLP
jgi:hypothetical protein